MSPGIYNLTGSIVISQNNTVVLGLGFPTLVSGNGQPCIKVADFIGGVRLAGVLLEAGATHSQALLQWGSTVTTSTETRYTHGLSRKCWMGDVRGCDAILSRGRTLAIVCVVLGCRCCEFWVCCVCVGRGHMIWAWLGRVCIYVRM